jgi:hypothetical protein
LIWLTPDQTIVVSPGVPISVSSQNVSIWSTRSKPERSVRSKPSRSASVNTRRSQCVPVNLTCNWQEEKFHQ